MNKTKVMVGIALVLLFADAGAWGQVSLESDSNDVSKIVHTLGMSQAEAAGNKGQIVAASKALTDMGDAGVAAIMDYKGWNGIFEKRAIEVLKEIKSEKAQQALLEIALGKHSVDNNGNRYAAGCYVKNGGDAEKLLESENSLILEDAFRALKGHRVDINLLEHLRRAMQSQNPYLCMQAADVMGADPNDEYVQEKIATIITTMEKVEEIQDVNKPFPNPMALGTIGDHIYASFIDAMAKMPKADEYLEQATDKVKGKSRWSVIIARANRGDTRVKSEIYKIINDPTAGSMRAYAVHSMDEIGTPEDLPMLQKLAASDPLEVEVSSDLISKDGKKMRKYYPVRTRAEFAIKCIETKFENKSSTR